MVQLMTCFQTGSYPPKRFGRTGRTSSPRCQHGHVPSAPSPTPLAAGRASGDVEGAPCLLRQGRVPSTLYATQKALTWRHLHRPASTPPPRPGQMAEFVNAAASLWSGPGGRGAAGLRPVICRRRWSRLAFASPISADACRVEVTREGITVTGGHGEPRPAAGPCLVRPAAGPCTWGSGWRGRTYRGEQARGRGSTGLTARPSSAGAWRSESWAIAGGHSAGPAAERWPPPRHCRPAAATACAGRSPIRVSSAPRLVPRRQFGPAGHPSARSTGPGRPRSGLNGGFPPSSWFPPKKTPASPFFGPFFWPPPSTPPDPPSTGGASTREPRPRTPRPRTPRAPRPAPAPASAGTDRGRGRSGFAVGGHRAVLLCSAHGRVRLGALLPILRAAGVKMRLRALSPPCCSAPGSRG